MKFSLIFFAFVLCLFTRSSGQEKWTLDTLQIGGIRQVVAVKGLDKGPLLLFLHGGPGSSRMGQINKFTDQLEKHFLVVHWDQRGSGATAALNKTDVAISLELMISDTRAVIDSLLNKYGQKKLYLVGESWGTVLGFKMAELIPEKIQAYLAFSPVIDQVKSEKLLLARLLDDAKLKGNKNAQKELEGVHIPFVSSRDLYYSRKWWFKYDGDQIADKDTVMLRDFIKVWSDKWLHTWNKALERNLNDELPELKCPVYFFVGGKDYQTNFDIAKSYYQKLRAPKKQLYWFDEASHDVLVIEAAKIQRIIIDQILSGNNH